MEIYGNFKQSMNQYKHEFTEQKVTLVDDAEMAQKMAAHVKKTIAEATGNGDVQVVQPSGGMADSKKEAEKLLRGKVYANQLKKKSARQALESLKIKGKESCRYSNTAGNKKSS